VIEAHDLRTRKGGATRHMDFHMVVCGNMTVSRSHEVCDEMELRILAKFPGASVTIHVEPCEHHHSHCHQECLKGLPPAGGSASTRTKEFRQ